MARALWIALALALPARPSPVGNDDYAWNCSAFSNDEIDEGSYSNATCASADASLCDHLCSRCSWCAAFCTDDCARHQGAVCAYTVLSDLEARRETRRGALSERAPPHSESRSPPSLSPSSRTR